MLSRRQEAVPADGLLREIAIDAISQNLTDQVIHVHSLLDIECLLTFRSKYSAMKKIVHFGFTIFVAFCRLSRANIISVKGIVGMAGLKHC